MEIGLTKGRFAPITQRYVRGTWQGVSTNTKPRKGTIANINCKHNGDYKTAYCSDPLLIVHAELGITHDEIETTLKEIGLWKDEFIPIEIAVTGPNGNPRYKNGVKSLPRSKNEYETLADYLKRKGELPLEGPNSITVDI